MSESNEKNTILTVVVSALVGGGVSMAVSSPCSPTSQPNPPVVTPSEPAPAPATPAGTPPGEQTPLGTPEGPIEPENAGGSTGQSEDSKQEAKGDVQ